MILGRPAFYCPQVAQPINCELLLHFDESTSPYGWVDSSAQQHPLSAFQIPMGSVTDPGPPPITYNFSSTISSVPGKFINGAFFNQGFPANGSNNVFWNTGAYLTAGNDVHLDSNEFFFSMFYDRQTAAPSSGTGGGYLALMSTRRGAFPYIDGWSFSLVLVSGAIVPQFVWGNGGVGGSIQGNPGMPVNSGFQHLAVSRVLNTSAGQDSLTLFINGVISNTLYITSASNFGAAIPGLRIGVDEFSTQASQQDLIGSLQGVLDEVFIIKGAGTGVNTAFTVPPTPYSGQPFRPWLGL